MHWPAWPFPPFDRQITAHTPFPSTPIFTKKGVVPKSGTLSPPLKQLGGNIRRQRLAKGLTQQQLAEFADLNIRNVQRIEAGELDILLSTTARIKKALGCSWDKLMPEEWR